MRKLKFLTPLIIAGLALAGFAAAPAGATVGLVNQQFRDINSPNNSCAYTTADIDNEWEIGTNWEQTAFGETAWFINDPGCAFGGTQQSSAANTLRYQAEIVCSTDRGATGWVAFTSPTVYNAAGVGHASWSPTSSNNWCGFTGAVNSNYLARLVVFGGYLIGGTWFNTTHTSAWSESI